MRLAHGYIALFVSLVIAPSVFAQDERLTIPEIVARGSAMSVSQACGLAPLPPFSDLLHQSDLLVTGTVGPSRSYLSDDQRDVYTDHQLAGVIVYYEVPSKVPAITLPRPGVVPQPVIAVTELGGTIEVDGRSFSQVIQYPVRKLTPGMTGLFLLKRNGARFWLTTPTLGAFEIANDRLRPLTVRDDFAPEYRSVPVRTAIQAMLDILHQH